jgi:putative ABC transport system permease protein
MVTTVKRGQLFLPTKFAFRELRNGIRGFRIFIACLILGVSTIAGIGTLNESIEGGLKRDGRKLLGGDISIRLLHLPAKKEHIKYFKTASDFSEIIELRAMARNIASTGSRTIVELKAVDDAYPLVGNFMLKEKISLNTALSMKDGLWGVVADASLQKKLNLAVGDILELGDSKFRLMGIIKKEPDRVANVFSFGPRLMVLKSGLGATNLIQPGSQIRYRYRILVKNVIDSKAWLTTLKNKFPEMGWQIQSAEEVAPGLQRFINRMTLFLSFVGLTTLLIGGTGVSNAVSSYLESKINSIATYKCLGAKSSFIFQMYFIQVLVLAGLGTLVGLILGSLLPVIGIIIFSDIWPVSPKIGFYPNPLIIACVFSFLITLTFTLWPISKAQNIPAATLFRNLVQPPGVRPNLTSIVFIIVGVLCLASLIITTSSDKWFSVWFIIGAFITLILLKAAATVLIYLAKKIKNTPNVELRLALSSLFRPGANTSNIIISLGLGLTVLITVNLIESNLSSQIKDRLPSMAPAFFFIDIQSNQISDFDNTINSISGIGRLRRVATLRGRIVKINQIPVENARIASDVKWAVRGDRALTYASKPAEDTHIVAGKWWDPNYKGPPLISLDSNIAKGFGVNVGDTLTINILGRNVKAKIASLRKIDWRSLRFDFAIIFAPGTLELAPQSHIAALQAPKKLEAKIEKAISDRFNNISIIRVREALQAAAAMLNGIGTAIQSTAAITILGGSLVLAGAVAAGRRRRIYESVVFKVLGATRQTILKSFLIEYVLLGIATALVSIIIGTIAAWSIIVFLMKMSWVFMPTTIWNTVFICLAITIFVGFAGTWHALGQKAAPILRNE